LGLDEFLSKISVYAIPALFAVTLHEVAHGWAAKRCGDRTAELLGRLSLNPLKHVDLVGTLLIPALLLGLRLPFFGWARPVPFATAALPHPRRTLILVALAGPAANLVMAMLWGGVLAAAVRAQNGRTLDSWLILMAQAGIVTNIFLGFFNLVPIPPLDGGRVLTALLPERMAATLQKAEPVGVLLVLGLAATRGFGWAFKPAYRAIDYLVSSAWVAAPV
jgi:Zn-dependent protease